jgi:undecaprenyl-diphosphatase
VSWKQAFLIGCAQVCALLPGTSRSGATIVGGLLVSLDRKTAAEFSFLLAMPVMLATTAYAVLTHHSELDGSNLTTLAVGFFTAFVVAFLSVRWLIHFLAHYTFRAFGVYRIVLGIVLLIWFR